MSNGKKYGSSLRDVMVAAVKHANGEYGKEVLDGTNKPNSTFGVVFRHLHTISEVTFDAISDYESGTWDDGGTETSDIESLIGVPIPANTTLFGRFYDLKLANGSGILMCYVDGSEADHQRVVSPIKQVLTPAFKVDTDIVLTCDTPGASIYYSTTNPVPIPGEMGTTLYTAAIALPVGDTTYYAKGYKKGMHASPACKYTYIVPTP